MTGAWSPGVVAVLATLAAAQLPPDLDTESQLVEGVQASNTVPMIGKKNSPQGEVSQLLYPYLLRILDLGLRCTLCITHLTPAPGTTQGAPELPPDGEEERAGGGPAQLAPAGHLQAGQERLPQLLRARRVEETQNFQQTLSIQAEGGDVP